MPVKRKLSSGRPRIREFRNACATTYSPHPVRCTRKRDSTEPWTRQLMTTEYARRLGFKINIQWKLRQMEQEKGMKGPGYYNIKTDTFKESIMADGKGFTTSKRPVPAEKNTNPGPCSYAGDVITDSPLIQKKFTKTPHFEWSGFADRFRPVIDESWKIPPNKYNPKDTGGLEALLNKRVSIKGPYNLFTGARDETSIKNHFGFAAPQGADNIYEKPAYVDLLLAHPNYRRCGIVYRKPVGDPKIVYDKAGQPRRKKSPGPTTYDITWHSIKASPPSTIPFLSTSKLKTVLVSSGPGPGRYFYVKKQVYRKRPSATRKSSGARRLSETSIIVSDRRVSKILKKFAKSAKKSVKAKRRRSSETTGSRHSSRRSTMVWGEMVRASISNASDTRRSTLAPRLSAVQKAALAAAAATPQRQSADNVDDGARRSSLNVERQRLDSLKMLGMIGENPDTSTSDAAFRKSRVLGSPIDRLDMVARLSRITSPKKFRKRRVSQVSGSTMRSSASEAQSSVEQRVSAQFPQVESLQLGVSPVQTGAHTQVGTKLPVRLHFSRMHTAATEGDENSLYEPNATQPILGLSHSKGRLKKSGSDIHMAGKSSSKAHLTRSKTQLAPSASKSRLRTSRTRLTQGGDSKSRLTQGSGSKSRLTQGGGSKSRLTQGGGSKSRLTQGGGSKSRLSGSKSRLTQGGGSKSRLSQDGGSKSRLSQDGGSKSRLAQGSTKTGLTSGGSGAHLDSSLSKTRLYQVQSSLTRLNVQPVPEKKSSLRSSYPKTEGQDVPSKGPAEFPSQPSLGIVSVTPSKAAALAQARTHSHTFNVVPNNVEAILYEHPFVLEAMVAGNPRDKYPVVLVVLREGCHVTELDLVTFINARVSRSERLRAGLKIMSRLPKRRGSSAKRVNIQV